MNYVELYDHTTVWIQSDLKNHLENNKSGTSVVKTVRICNDAITVDLENVLFTQCIFEDIVFQGKWHAATFQQCGFKNCAFQINGTDISFFGSIFLECVLHNSRIPKADFTKSEFTDTKAVDCDFNHVNFSLSNYQDLVMKNCKTSHTLLEQIEATKKSENEMLRRQLLRMYKMFSPMLDMGVSNFDENDTLQKLHKDLLEWTTYQSSKLQKKNTLKQIEPGDLHYMIEEHEKVADSPVKVSEIKAIDLSGCDFRGFNFQEHNLSMINFSGSDLRNCCFAGCDLSGCNFSDCDMSGAILFNAHFNQVVFDNTKLDNIILDNRNRDSFIKADIITGAHIVNTKQEEDDLFE